MPNRNDNKKPAGGMWRRGPLGRWMLAIVICAATSSIAGCSLFPKKPVSDKVVAARQLSLLGQDAMQKARWEEAESLFAQSLEICPVNERAHSFYAQALWHRGDRVAAISHMEQAVRLSAGDPELLVTLGEMYLESGDLPRASDRAQRAIAAHNQLPAAWALWGDVNHQRGDLDEALASYHRAMAYQADYPEVQLQVAKIYHRQRRPRRALATLEVLAEHYPPNQIPPEVLYLNAMALKALGRYEQAAQQLALASQRGNRTVQLMYQLGEARWLAGDPVNARLAVQEALALDPQHQASLQLREQIEASQQRMTAALEVSAYAQ